MRAAIYKRYGPPQTVSVADLPKPTPAANEVLVRVHASSVTTADWRLRAAAFPGILWLPGRLMTGIFAPRQQVLGQEFAGVVEAVGADVTEFTPGQRVFGFSGNGSHAEFVTVPESGAILQTPDTLSDAEAAALPFGAATALEFLRDVAKVQPGQHVLVVGATGGVGVYAVQMAKALGAHVTAVSSAANADLARELGADDVIDYRREDPGSARNAHDVVFDAVGATSYAQMRKALRKDGLYLPLNFGGRELWTLLMTKLRGGPRITLHVNGDTKQHLRDLLALIDAGKLRAVIDRHFDLDHVVDAHAFVETRHRKGAVILDILRRSPAALPA
ncbi:MAG: NAD(P)-dependent alcohol dehydrogenase [Paracoccaceae bacterium]|nr:NAD(P)-dependent alcohol dehydrogenase [Paracoccaceae bacterium]